jgi:hypothetical protein
MRRADSEYCEYVLQGVQCGLLIGVPCAIWLVAAMLYGVSWLLR